MNAGEITTAARDLHPAFDVHRNPQAMLYRFLTRYQRELAAKAVKMDPLVLADLQTETLPLAVFADGITLDAHQFLHGADVVYLNNADERTPVTILPWANRFQHSREPSAYVAEQTLFLRGVAADWASYASIRISLTPVMGTVSSDATTMTLPDTALAACVDACGAFMAGRGHTDKALPPINLVKFVGDASESEAAWLDDIFQHRSGKTNKVRVVRSYS